MQEILQDIVFLVLYGIVMGLSIAAALYLLLWRVETLQALSENAPAEEEEADGDAQKASAPQTASADIIAPLLKKHCEDNHFYLQHDISLSQLALAIGTNHYYLSQYFSQQGLSYNTYINGLRIRHFIRLYEKAVAENRTFTAQQLATESGYRSYSTFSAAFKQYTGKTVTAWMNEAGE